MFISSFLSGLAASSVLFTEASGASINRVNSRRDETPALPYDPNTTQYCTWWYDNDGSVPCTDIPTAWSITLEDFKRWNPIITDTCGNFETGKSYCVEAFGEPEPEPSPTSTSTSAVPTPTGNGITTPTPIQPGMVSNCDSFYFVKSGDQCGTIASSNGISLADFNTWNPQVGSGCAGLWADVYVCVSIIGVSPSATSTTVPSPTNGISTPSPIQTGMVTNCDAFYFVKSGDQCSTIASANSISLADFYAWNPAVGNTCSSLWLDTYVCVSIIGASPTITSTSTTTVPTPTNGISTPSPIQTGMVSNCDAFHFVKSGDQCGTIASTYGITLARFYAWNPAVGNTCSSLWLDTYVCVSIIGVGPSTTTAPATTTAPGNGIVTPTPIQTGMVSNCDAFYKVKSGDQCGSIASANGISLAQFYNWNPAVGNTCAALWLDTYVCVSIVGVLPTTTTSPPVTTTAPGNGITTPTPFQTGMTTRCKTFHLVKSGDTCTNIAASAGVSVATFISWNPAAKSDCTGLWLDTYACIAVL